MHEEMPRYDTVLHLVIISRGGEELVLVYSLFVTFERLRMNSHPFRTSEMKENLGTLLL